MLFPWQLEMDYTHTLDMERKFVVIYCQQLDKKCLQKNYLLLQTQGL